MANSNNTGIIVTAEDGTKLTCFWSKKYIYSNFFPCQIIIDGISYNCSEQFYMHEKSIFAIANSTNDATTRKYEDLGRKIMQLKNPAKIKQLGNVVQNTPGFDKVNWDKAKVDIMKKAVYHKFTQNATLHDALMNTEGSILVEASPSDSFWGASCGTDDPRIVDYKNYEGENMLGQILMEIRDKWIGNKKGSKQRLAIKMKKKHF